ncbi:hypothetical protein AVV44_gp056 [Cronobacter phage S13]|jgi:hypothetical protein|uniref:Uncharacterized protein n=1 Tax=Cronobacter phage LPCS28 TaxID=2924885 RepID=A0AAE9G7X1_9CAUD|nr:hypothetical protein AVV44_gp056 [Cronobacter phage S13]YP_010665907.1 hypothetical protein PQB73_gp117 [Cronobacter phage LPCS28]AIA64855.1 hypothetical protein S13_056 [Cronobacter phage S13]UNY47096.1 hypothetical protein EHEKIMEA_00214 [Cronobacter phage LPCS28]
MTLRTTHSLKVSKFVGVQSEILGDVDFNALTPIFIAGNTVLAISAATFALARHNKCGNVFCVELAKEYTEEFDLLMLNTTRAIVVRYHEIRDHFKEPENVKGIGFDNSELDFMYKINLDNERYDIKVLESDAVVLKKDQFFTIKCKTREESILVRQYFKTIDHEITFDKFEKVIKGQMNSLASMFGEDDEESIPIEKLEVKCDTNFRIKYDNEDQLKEIFEIFKLPAKKKTVRVSYKNIKGILN